jgi:hypothetical protein
MESSRRDSSRLPDALMAEHMSLQTARAATVTESVGRTMIYMGSLSASLIALALIAQSESTGEDFRLLALVILPALIFLGTVTFVRIVETGIEDAICAQAINRIRHYYLELAGDQARYFLLGGHDDMDGELANKGIVPSRWRPLLSVAGVVAVINSTVVGALLGVAVDAFAPRSVAIAVGVAVALIAIVAHYQLGFRRFLRALDRFAPIFPTQPSVGPKSG